MPQIYSLQVGDPEKQVDEAKVTVQRDFEQDGRLRPGAVDAFALKEGDEDRVDFKDLGWNRAGMIATCEAVALGTLSFPSNFAKLGLAGGLICNVLVALISWLTSLLMLRHPFVMNVADCGEVLFGKWGARIFGVGLVAKSIGLASSHILAGKIAISTFDSGANCSIIWTAVITIGSAVLSYQRHWSGLTYISIASLTCIVTACIITMAGASTQDPSTLIKNGIPVKFVAFNTDLTLADGIGAVTNTVFAYGGTMAVLSFLPEMKRPEAFKKSLAIVQLLQLVIYSVVGAVLYHYGGQYTPSPALTMTTHKIAVISYAFALVTILASGVVAVNVGAKYAYVTLLRDSPLLTSRGWKAQGTWIGIIAVMYAVGFVIAELVPFFSQLLTIVSCLFSTWFVVGLGGILYFHLYNPRNTEKHAGWFSSPVRAAMFGLAVFLIVAAATLMPLGLYAAARGISSGFHHPFSCAS
ncbi:hypothetical protein JCM8097_002834 [Rhodosporidiobolus ruineniae]